MRPKVLSQKEINQLIEMFTSHFGEQKNPVLQTKLLLSKSNPFKRKMLNLKKRISFSKAKRFYIRMNRLDFSKI
jgi:hypothetical protein